MNAKTEFSEENLYPLWDNFCTSHSWSDDLRLQGINSGVLNLFEGPDFQGADFELDGKLYHGDVEIHRTTRDWYQHNHHLDRRYNSVQLHLVWHHEPTRTIYTCNKRRVKTFDIKKLIQFSGHSRIETQCHLSQIEADIYLDKLKNLSLERLLYKTIRVKNLLKYYSYDQVIFLLYMRILGSPNNSDNFELLASSLPWEEIFTLKHRYNWSLQDWILFFLSMGGFKNNTTSLEKSARKRSITIVPKAPFLSRVNWQLSGQRPHNHPAEHLKKLAVWLYTLPFDSLYFTLKNILNQRQPVNELCIEIGNVFSIKHSSRTTTHRIEQLRLSNFRWGRSKVIEIIGNAIIPFFNWEAAISSSYGFQEYLHDIYFQLPQPNRYSQLRKFDKYSILDSCKNRQWAVDQGLLFLDLHYCKTGDCQNCPMISEYKDIDKNYENI